VRARVHPALAPLLYQDHQGSFSSFAPPLLPLHPGPRDLLAMAWAMAYQAFQIQGICLACGLVVVLSIPAIL
jgi:hypothetical protein